MSATKWTTQYYVYVTAECVTGILSVLGNSLVLIAIWRTRALRTVTNCFIGSLAAADVLVGIVIPPTVLLPYRGLPKDFYGCVLLNTVVVLITNISILNLLAVALERYVAISDPFRYQRLMTVNRAMVVVVITWVIAILLGLVPIMGWNLGKEGFTNCSFVAVIDMKYMVYLIFLGVNVPPLVSMLVIYMYIFHIIRKQQRRTVAQLTVLSRDERRNVRQQKREVRGAKGLAYVIILFAVCWMPLHIMNSFTLFAPEKSAPYKALLAAIVLSHANSFVNPFLYAFSNSQFKRAMQRILCCGRLQSTYGSDSSDGTTRFRATRPSDGDVRYNANGHLRSSESNAPNGNAPIELIAEDLSKGDSDHAKHSVRTGVSANINGGVVNEAFDKDEMDLSDEEIRASPSHSPSFPRKSLRWLETVTTIPRQNGAEDAKSDVVSGDNVLVITENDNEGSLNGHPQSQVWVTPSSRFFEHDVHESPSAHKEYATPPPSYSEQHNPYKDQSGKVVPQSTNSKKSVISADDLDPVNATGAEPEGQGTTKGADPVFSADRQAGAAFSPSLTQTAERGAAKREEETGQQSVAIVCTADEDGEEDLFGSKEFVSIRL